MAHIHPFSAWRPRTDYAEEVASVPYDVVDTKEALRLAEGRPYSFLHVIRPEIDLDPSIDLYDESVYEQGRKNLDYLINENVLEQESEPSVYIYRLKTPDGHEQMGLYTCVSVADYDSDVILKHELTKPDKEKDRIKHIKTQQAHAEPVMLTYKDSEDVAGQMNEAIQWKKPLYDFEAVDGVRHTIWQVGTPDNFVESFSRIPNLYVADGHHRCKSASEVAKQVGATRPEVQYFPAVIFPMSQMRVLAYNRIIYEIPDDFFEKLSDSFELKKNAHPKPAQKGEAAIYYDGSWYGMEFPGSNEESPVERLDVSRLSRYILEPILDIKDQRRDKNIDFVGGIHGTEALENLVDEGKAQVAISMYPTSIKELVDISDARELMPPKSTWFEPKLRSGLLVHRF